LTLFRRSLSINSVVMAPCKYGMGIEGGYMVGCVVNILQEDGTGITSVFLLLIVRPLSYT
jgi:hypothetical protein